MANLNSVQLIGRLGNKPEIRFTPTGKKVCRFSLAVNEEWTVANGEPRKRTDWLQVEAWSGVAEAIVKYLDKGRLVFVEGKIRIDEVQNNGSTSWYTKIQARNVQFLDFAKEQSSGVGNKEYQLVEDEQEFPF